MARLNFFPIDLKAIGGGSGVGSGISSTTGAIVGSAFTELPLSDFGRFHIFIGVRSTKAFPSWRFIRRKVPGAVASCGRGLNDSGDLVGYSINEQNQIYPYIWYRGAKGPTSINIAGAPIPKDRTIHNSAFGINHSGVVVGQYAKFDGSPGHFHHSGFVVDASAPGALTKSLDVPADTLGASAVVVRGINSFGDIVGRCDIPISTTPRVQTKVSGFVSTDAATAYHDCQLVEIKDAQQTVVGGIDDNRRIVGSYIAQGHSHGFMWRVGKSGNPVGHPTLIDYPDAGYSDTQLNQIDNQGLMIGTAGIWQSGAATLLTPFVCWYG